MQPMAMLGANCGCTMLICVFLWCCVVYDVLLGPCLVTLVKYFKPPDLTMAAPFALARWQRRDPERVNVAHARCELCISCGCAMLF